MYMYLRIFSLDSLAFRYQFSSSGLSPLRICDNNSGEMQYYMYMYMYTYHILQMYFGELISSNYIFAKILTFNPAKILTTSGQNFTLQIL